MGLEATAWGSTERGKEQKTGRRGVRTLKLAKSFLAEGLTLCKDPKGLDHPVPRDAGQAMGTGKERTQQEGPS